MGQNVTTSARVPQPARTDTLHLSGWPPAAEPTFVPVGRRRLAARDSRLATLLGAVHASDRGAFVVLVDLIVLLGVSTTLAPHRKAYDVAFCAAVVTIGYLALVYAERDSIQTRGVLWYPGKVVTPLAVVALVSATVGAVPLTGATMLCLFSLTALTLLRCLTWLALVLMRRSGRGLRRTLIIGDAGASTTVWRRLVEFPEVGLLPVQLLAYQTAHQTGVLEREFAERGIEHVVLVAPGPDEGLFTAALPRHDGHTPFFSAVPALSELFLDPRSVSEVGGVPLIPLGRVTRRRHAFPGKRVLDLACSALLVLASAPLLVLVALAIKLDDGGPVFYRQPRTGRDNHTFRMLKFRTMVVDADRMLDQLRERSITDGLLFKMHDDPRITRLGRLLRRTSLDELPQILNVLRGDMSLVGPRPLPVNPDDFDPIDSERHSVLPGITGYWQLSGGPELTYAEMVRLDLAYIRNWSLWLDIRLLLRTVPAVLHRHGAC